VQKIIYKKDKCLKYFNHEHCYFALQNSPCCCIGFTDPLLQLAISVAAGLQELQIADTERAQYWSTAAAAEKLALGLSWKDGVALEPRTCFSHISGLLPRRRRALTREEALSR